VIDGTADRADPARRERTISPVHPGDAGEFEVVWPLDRWHYLTVPDPDVPADPPPLASTWAAGGAVARNESRTTAVTIGVSNGDGHDQRVGDQRLDGDGHDPPDRDDSTPPQARALAVRAFLQGATCREPRVRALLGVSARTLGRDRAHPLLTAPAHLERAQTLIAASADRGSTVDERAAAIAWLLAAARDEHLVEVTSSPTGHQLDRPLLKTDRTLPKAAAAKPSVSHSRHRKTRGHARRPTHQKVPSGNGAATPTAVTSTFRGHPREVDAAPAPAPHTSLTGDQVDACGRLHRRIRIRTDAACRLLEAGTAHDDLLEVVLEQLVAIRGATEALDTLLQAARIP
jgi:hypothetical protein